MKKEPAEALLQRKPSLQTTMEKEGFVSALYRPEKNCYLGKVMVIVGGSDGYYSLTRLIAEQFLKRGLTVLALAYWNREGLPRTCSHIPLETGELAGKWLRKRGYDKIGIWGVSLGSIFALLCASKMPEYYSCAVAVSPNCVCVQGIQKKSEWVKETGLCEGSAFSYHGEDIPFSPLVYKKGKVLADMSLHREVYLRSIYESAVKSKEKPGAIEVENMNGPVLFLAADHDSMWPSKESAEYMVKRLKDHGFAYPVCYEHYETASHFLLPYKLKSSKMFKVERKYPDDCSKSNLDAFKKTLKFIKETW